MVRDIHRGPLLDAMRNNPTTLLVRWARRHAVGTFAEGKKTVVETFPLENAREEEARHDRILILPKDVLRAERYARERKLDVVGYYHSHPDDRAVPSQYDLDHALPVWSYIIASVLDGKVDDIASWEMEKDRSRFNEEPIEIASSSTDSAVSVASCQ